MFCTHCGESIREIDAEGDDRLVHYAPERPEDGYWWYCNGEPTPGIIETVAEVGADA